MNLRKMLQDKTGKEDGFTLVELLVVIVILGVLSAVVVFSVSGISNNSESSACKSDVKSVEVATESYYAQKGAYPADLDDMQPEFLRSINGAAVDGGGNAVDGTMTMKTAGNKTIVYSAGGKVSNPC